MPSHWTYADIVKDSDLEQGDILRPSSELTNLFKEVHPHFCDDKYLGFMVATQTCDLVRRKGESKAHYISLTVIRPLSKVARKLVGQAVREAAPGRFPKSKKLEARQLLERVLNQNEQSLGLFYLHEDADLEIGEPSVALLRVTVAIKAQHYELLIESRTGRLKTEFQAKLGWLLGNLYNRPASSDWSDQVGGKKKLDTLIDYYLGENEMSTDFGFSWIDDILIQKARSENRDLSAMTQEDLEALRPKPEIDVALDTIERVLRNVSPDIEDEKLDKLKRRLKANVRFTKFFVTS